MKKARVAILLTTLLVFGAMAIGSGSGSETKEISSSGQSEEVYDGVEDASESADEESSSESDGEDNTENTGFESAAGDSKSDITIETQVLLEADGIRITAEEYVTDDIWGDGIKLLIENDGENDMTIGCNALIVNDYMITDLFSATVAAGKKSYETLYLYNTELEASGIENVGKIEVYFHSYNADDYMSMKDYDCITIQTSAYDNMDATPDDSGFELYNDGGIRIVGKYVDENSFWGAAVLLYIENNCGKNKIIQCEDMSINGFMVTPYLSSTVYDGKKAIDEITLLSSDLETNNITTVEEIELKFKIIDEDFMNSIETDVIAFSAK